MSEFDLFKIYFEDNFYVIENWFKSYEKLFDYIIQWSLLFIHIKSCKETETKILENIIKSTQLAIDYSINHQKMQSIAIKILYHSLKFYSDSKLKELSFDRYKCIQLVMKSIINFELNDKDSDITDSFNNICADIIRIILNYEKSNSSSKPMYVKTLLDIIGMSVEYKKTYNNLLVYCLDGISNETKEVLLKEKVFDLYFLVLKVSLEIFAYFVFQYKFSFFQEFIDQKDIEKKVLLCIYNKSSAPDIKNYLIKREFISVLRLF